MQELPEAVKDRADSGQFVESCGHRFFVMDANSRTGDAVLLPSTDVAGWLDVSPRPHVEVPERTVATILERL